jgi:hypothetical protein
VIRILIAKTLFVKTLITSLGLCFEIITITLAVAALSLPVRFFMLCSARENIWSQFSTYSGQKTVTRKESTGKIKISFRDGE